MAGMAALLLFMPGAAEARSVLEGLEIVESESGEGVEILSCDSTSPAALAGLRAGDRITAIGGSRIRNLDDYVRVSKKIGQKRSAIAVEYYRDGSIHKAELALHSASLAKKWGVHIIPWAEAGEGRGSDYWLAQARAQELENERKAAAEPADHGKVILSLFTALDAAPDSLPIAMLIGRKYGELASFYAGRGENRKAAWCLRRALLLYGNSLQKAGEMQEMVLVKNGLGDLRKTLGEIQ